eukprot:gb/GECH01011376.1/.p1 GENE.gb/GECH01011376.1/~~gb/GECH01011376.1/.p1  ORF type:complete len:157 (+),score=33.46 gb/GECH01011376.1/:1-471(+)
MKTLSIIALIFVAISCCLVESQASICSFPKKKDVNFCAKRVKYQVPNFIESKTTDKKAEQRTHSLLKTIGGTKQNQPECQEAIKAFSCVESFKECQELSGTFPPCNEYCQNIERNCDYHLDACGRYCGSSAGISSPSLMLSSLTLLVLLWVSLNVF